MFTQVEDILSGHLHVLVLERLDESLVLMKRKFNWNLDDILYGKRPPFMNSQLM